MTVRSRFAAGARALFSAAAALLVQAPALLAAFLPLLVAVPALLAPPPAHAQSTREGAAASAGRVVIADFSIAAADGLRPGDELKLSMIGTPGGQAAAEVAGIPERIALAEVRRGVYEGAYTVRRQDRPRSPLAATGFLSVGGVEALQRYAGDAAGAPVAAVPAAAERGASAVAACPACGVVEAVNAVEAKGEGNNVVGTIAGGVLGGVLGHQVGGGTGKNVATVAGALGGAYAGNRVQNNMNKTMHHQVVVRLGDGTTRTFTYAADPGLKAGDRVRVENEKLVRN
jgi:outer membrane lipoprotein SlyB